MFGGFGRNIFNPAITGRAFIYISFGAPMTAAWVNSFKDFPGGFGAFASDAVTRATPMMQIAQGVDVPRLSMLFGYESGCMGETSVILLLIGGIYIIWKKYANYRIVFSGFMGMLVVQTALWLAGISRTIDPLAATLGGGWMMGILYMATCPVTSSSTNTGRWIYGAFIGAVTAVIRIFSIWSGGIMFAILLGNMFAPILDYYIKQAKQKGVKK